jgi:3-methyladenine DNA glycosylase AlkD
MATVDEVLAALRSRAQSKNLEGMARYGLAGEGRLGVRVPDLRQLAKEVGPDHPLALELWQTGIPEAMSLASMVGEPDEVTEAQMEAWVVDLQAWDVCDQVCMNLFEKSPLAWKKIRDWSTREEEFVKRAAYALLACLAWHDKGAPDQVFVDLLPVIHAGASDGRHYVKKAVSWALRNIGKRNPALHALALETAEQIRAQDTRPAQWIAADVVRDLTSPVSQRRLEKQRSQ